MEKKNTLNYDKNLYDRSERVKKFRGDLKRIRRLRRSVIWK